MDIYIDFPNFCSYLSSMSHRDFKEVNEIMMASCDLKFTFDQSKMAMVKKDIKNKFQIWLTGATKNRHGRSNEWNVLYPQRPIDRNNFLKADPQKLSSIYLISGEDADKESHVGCLLIADGNNDIDIIKNLQVANRFIPTKKYRIRDMTNWSNIGNNSSPCTDIIIVDQYLFLQEEIYFEKNAYAILEELSKWAKNEILNIVIFCFFEGCYKDSSNHRVPYQIPSPSIQRAIKKKIENVVGVEPNLTLVKLPQFCQHDRTIFSNYKMFTSGDSFTYFKGDDNISMCSHGEWMHVDSLIDNDNYNNAFSFISDLQDVVNDAQKHLGSIIGDKQCNYLLF